MSGDRMVKLATLMLLPLLLISHGVGHIRCSLVPENSMDMLALLDFRAIANDPLGSLSSWNNSIHYCSWRGVACNSKKHGRVTVLNLASQRLSGSISRSVGNLTFLHTLDLSSNEFSGQIPHLNNLQKMEVLNLSYNSLDGIIRDTLTNCSNLKEFHLYHNLLNGAIPREIGLLKNVIFFALSDNNLAGTIPPTLGNITHLQRLYLGYNQLEGSIPDELSQFSNISVLALQTNQLSGSIPDGLFNLSSLQELSLRGNQLSKSLPKNMGDLTNLQKLYLGHNLLEGHIPDSIGNASMLDSIVLQYNNLTGRIPTSFGKLSSLSNLDLAANMLQAKHSKSWEFLHALGKCSSLQSLQLSANQLRGVIPNLVGNLSCSLQYLILGGNKLTGTVPPSIGNLPGLIQLTLDENSLTGTIGQWIGNLRNMQSLYLRKNNFDGPIPPLIGNFTQLTELYLDSNDFRGPIPSSLGRLPQLLRLDLSKNNLGGSIPPEISYLKQLISLRFASNKLNGNIPSGLALCQNLVIIEIDRNFITGNIPTSFGNLESLNKLNLAHNNLSGTIPAALGNLQLLNMLDLSYNNLQGEIPRDGVFRNASSVHLDGNLGLCGGDFDLHMPSCPSSFQRIAMKCTLIKLVIPMFGFLTLIMLIYIIVPGKKTSINSYTVMLSFGNKFPRISYKHLAEATRNFSEFSIIGRGSYGSVYRGKLTQAKVQVAIKVFDLGIQCADRSFLSECEALRGIKHRNLVPILTACSTIDNKGNDFRALVYEFMPNGNLDTWLHRRCAGVAPKSLSLAQRISIAVGIADALAYLHNDCGRPIIHCDLKPTNILLDDDMNAHLGDFGISRLLDSTSTTLGHSGFNSSVAVKGTIGYIPPEYAQSVHASTSGDVYSFGIILLEMLIGKRPTDSMFDGEINIVSFVEMNFPDEMLHIIDAHLQEEYKRFVLTRAERGNEVHRQCLMSLVGIALSCTRLLPSRRMHIRELVVNLNAARRSYVV